MAINFPDSPTNGQQTSAGGNTWQYNSTKSVWEKTLTSGRSSAGITTYANISDLPLSGVSVGEQAFVTGSNRMYISNGTGWYSISLVNTNPTITSVQDASAGTTPFTLATDGTDTVITITANDPEDIPLTYGYSITSGSLTNGGGTTATITQADNVFTITPSTTEAYAGTFNLTFTASDGINTATSANSFTLEFITIVTNSKYTALLATATPKNTTVYRYFKFLPQAMRSATPDAMQYSEFELTDGTSYYSPSSASQLYRADDTDGDDYVANQRVAASIDGSTSTKLYNGGWASKYYLYDMGSSFNTALTGWRYKTANDNDSRDPVSWTLLGSTNNTDWVLLDQRTQETITTSRQTATQDFTFNATNQAVFNAANTNYPIEVNGDAHAGTFSPYRSGGYSTYFDGGDWLELTGTALGNGNFTVEAWVWLDSLKDYNVIYDDRATGSSATGLALGVASTGAPYLYTNNGFQITSSQTCTAKKWYHISLVRSSGVITLYLDGTSGGTYSSSANFTDTNLGIGVARTYTVTSQFGGYIRDVRAVVGSAITPPSGGPTERLEAVTNTSLLTCHLPYIADGSTNDHSITVNGNVSIEPFSPYDYLEYDAANHGGSVYFDVVGDWITATGIDLSSARTIEFWYYKSTNSTALETIFSIGNGYTDNVGVSLFTRNGDFEFRVGSSIVYDSGSSLDLFDFTWHHIAIVISSSNSADLYINGSRKYSGSNVTRSNSMPISIGSSVNGLTWNFSHEMQGFISDFAIFNSAKYSGTTLTIPTAPLSSTGTELHIKGTDASIIDKSQNSNLKLVGNTTGSTTQAKFADTKSMYFDGTGDYISISDDDIFNMSGDFTIESWIMPSDSTLGGIFGTGHGSFATNSVVLTWDHGTVNDQFSFFVNNISSSQILTSNTASTNTWTHIAIVRSGSTITLYQNGSSVDTYTSSTAINISSSGLKIGSYWGGTFNGYLQDFRITQGLARYTAADETSNIPSAPLEG